MTKCSRILKQLLLCRLRSFFELTLLAESQMRPLKGNKKSHLHHQAPPVVVTSSQPLYLVAFLVTSQNGQTCKQQIWLSIHFSISNNCHRPPQLFTQLFMCSYFCAARLNLGGVKARGFDLNMKAHDLLKMTCSFAAGSESSNCVVVSDRE